MMSRRARTTFVAVIMLVVATAAIGPLRPAHATEAVQRFDIPAGDLGPVLTEIGATSGRAIAFPADLTKGLRAGPIRGAKTTRAALAEALAGTGLVQIGGETGPVTVRAARRADAAEGGAIVAPGVGPSGGKASGGAAGGAGLDLPDVDVLGDRARFGDRGFQAGDAGQTTRLGDAPAREVPIAVTSVTREVLRSQTVTSPTQALDNVSGVTLAPTSVGLNSFTIRGFNTAQTSVDGDPSLGSLYARVPIDDIERIDVLKGPTSLLSGVSLEGGLVNLVTKAPTDRTIRDVTVRYGSYGYKTLAFDLGGVVPNTEGLTYRLNMSGNAADKSYGGYRSPHEYLFAPVLRWQNETFDVLVGARYVDLKSALPTFTFAPNNLPTDETSIIRLPRGVPQDRPDLQLQTDARAVYSDQAVHLLKTRDVDVTFHNHVQYQEQRTYEDFFSWQLFQPTNGAYEVSPFMQKDRIGDLAERVDLTGVYDAGPFKQTSKVGYDFLSSYPVVGSISGQPIFVDPTSGLPRLDLASPPSLARTSQISQLSTVSGIYYLEKFDTLGDRLHIVGSVREDRFAIDKSIGSASSSHGAQNGLSWIAGGAFDLLPQLTVYGNRSNGFVEQPGITNQTAGVVPPEGRDGSEVGLRTYLFDKRLSITTSLFTLQQTNVAVADPTDLSGLRTIIVPGEASCGLEVEAQGELFAGLNVILAFADIHAAYQNINDTMPLQATPQITGSIWATYALQGGPLAGLVFGFGVHGNSSCATSVATSDQSIAVNLRVPGYVVEDAMIGYVSDDYSLRLKVNNLANRYFYYPSITTDAIVVGEGRNFLAVASKSF